MKIKINPGLEHITDRADLLQDFVVFVCKDLQCMPCDIDIVNGRDSSGLKTTAQYDPNRHHVMINAKNRHFGDVLRSIAHELVHHKQNVNGELSGPVQDVGGDIEDEANARAGAMLKSFAYRKGPERIYEQVSGEPNQSRQSLETQLRTFLGKVGILQAGGKDAKPDKEDDEKEKKKIEKFSAAKLELRKAANLLRDNPVPEYEKEVISPIAGMGAPNLADETSKRYAYRGMGVAVQSILSGIVSEIGSDKQRGNFVIVTHRVNRSDEEFDIYKVTYEHLGELTANVKLGQPIGQNIIIGYTGTEAEAGNEKNEYLNDDFFEIEILHTGNKIGDKTTRKKDPVDSTEFKIKNEASRPKLDRIIYEQVDELLELKQKFLNTFTVRKPLDTLEVSGGFGSDKEARGYIHKGIDYRGNSGKDPVYSSLYGKVLSARDGEPEGVYKNFKDIKDNCKAKKRGKNGGNIIKVETLFRLPDDKKIITFYAHLFDGSIKVKAGDLVKPGQQIGILGASGCTTGPHLHFGMKSGDAWIKSYEELREIVGKIRSKFNSVIEDDDKFLSLFEKTIPEAYRKPKLASESLESQTTIKNYINEIVSAYGTGRLDPMGGGMGRMFKLGVDYKNASTNVPRVGTGYVDRTHAMPYEIVIKTNRDPRELFKTMFENDFEAELVVIVPDQVHYDKDGIKMQCHVSTSRNKADSRDVKLIQDALYSSILGLPATPKDAQFVIDVKSVASKIRRFD